MSALVAILSSYSTPTHPDRNNQSRGMTLVSTPDTRSNFGRTMQDDKSVLSRLTTSTRTSSSSMTSLQSHNAASVPATSASSCSNSSYYNPLSFWEDNAKILEQDLTTPRRPSSPSPTPQEVLSSFVLEEWDESSAGNMMAMKDPKNPYYS